MLQANQLILKKHPEFEAVSSALKLSENQAFSNLIAHLHANFTKNGQNLLLSRFVTLLMQLEGSQEMDVKENLQ